jgi:outer membrane protein assembly factor BamB
MYMAHGGGLKIYVNGKEAYKTEKGYGMPTANADWWMTRRMDHRRFLRGDGNKATYADLDLEKGWNSLLIKLIKGGNINPVIQDVEEMKYETKNILWTTKMPDWGMCSPIVVKDKVFVTAEPDELICVDRNTGKILWHASNSYYEATPQEEKDKNPLFKEKITPLYEKLKASKNEDEQIELRYQIQMALEKVSVDKYPWHHVKSVTTVGFTYPTPTSDGKSVYFVNTLGVAAAYDLDGNRKWIKLITAYGDHGKLRDKYNTQFWNLASPLVAGDTLYINRAGLAALDKETGKEKWYVPALWPLASHGSENSGDMANMSQYSCTSPIYGAIGGVGVIVAGRSNVVRASDGKVLWGKDGNMNMGTPVIVGGIIYGSSTTVLEPDPSTVGTDTPVFKQKLGGPYSETSPLYYKGLLYVCSQTGLLTVFDPKEMKQVYKQQLDFNSLQLYHTIGGGFLSADGNGGIFASDNQGNTVVLESGRVFKQLTKNKIEHFVRRIYCVPQQESGQSYMFIDGNNIFIRSEENLYCIGVQK